MAVISLIGKAADGYKHGIDDSVDDDFPGINVSSFTPTAKPVFREPLLNIKNIEVGAAVGPTVVELAVEGEVSSNYEFDFTKALTITTIFTPKTSNTVYFLEEITAPQVRGAWQTVSLKFESKPGYDPAILTAQNQTAAAPTEAPVTLTA